MFLARGVGHGFFIFSILPLFFFTACIGGGGGGGGGQVQYGGANKEIARTHGLSEVTIKHHLKSLRSKLGARNRTHAVCRAIELGIAEEAIPALS